MKNNLLTFGTILAIGFFTLTANAQTAQTTSAAAGARLVKPMTITKTADLNFGTINVGTGLIGTVALSTAGTNTYTGGVTAGTIAGTITNAAYNVTGTKNATYVVTLPADNTVTVEESGGTTMKINTFTALSASGATATHTALGADTFKVGATLLVAAGQATGIYAGTFNVSVDYN